MFEPIGLYYCGKVILLAAESHKVARCFKGFCALSHGPSVRALRARAGILLLINQQILHRV